MINKFSLLNDRKMLILLITLFFVLFVPIFAYADEPEEPIVEPTQSEEPIVEPTQSEEPIVEPEEPVVEPEALPLEDDKTSEQLSKIEYALYFIIGLIIMSLFLKLFDRLRG